MKVNKNCFVHVATMEKPELLLDEAGVISSDNKILLFCPWGKDTFLDTPKTISAEDADRICESETDVVDTDTLPAKTPETKLNEWLLHLPEDCKTQFCVSTEHLIRLLLAMRRRGESFVEIKTNKDVITVEGLQHETLGYFKQAVRGSNG